MRGRAQARVAAWPTALLPPLGFAVQEHLERGIEHNALPLGAALETTFAVGMALQLPLAVAALLLARAALAWGHALGRRVAVGRVPRPPAQGLEPLLPDRPETVVARPPILGGRHGQRGPPRPAVA